MSRLQNIFSVYIVVVMFLIGIYMVWVQSPNLKEIYQLNRESKFAKFAGYSYILIAVIAYALSFLY